MTNAILVSACPLPDTLTRAFWESKDKKELLRSSNAISFIEIVNAIEESYISISHDVHFDTGLALSSSDLNHIYKFYSKDLSHHRVLIVKSTKSLKTLIDGHRRTHAANDRLIVHLDKALGDLVRYLDALAAICASARGHVKSGLTTLEDLHRKFGDLCMSDVESFLNSVENHRKHPCRDSFDALLRAGDKAMETLEQVPNFFEASSSIQPPLGPAVTAAMVPLRESLPVGPMHDLLSKYTTTQAKEWTRRYQQQKSGNSTLLDFIMENLRQDHKILELLVVYFKRSWIVRNQLKMYIDSYERLFDAVP